jgi:membrane protein
VYLISLFSDAAGRFDSNEGLRLVAAFSFYATFSIFPLLLLSVTFVGFLVGDSATARERLLDAIASPDSPVHEVLDRTLSAMQASQSSRGKSAFIGGATLLFAASGAFVELDAALNRIWCVPPRKPVGLAGWVHVLLLERLSGFLIVLGLGTTLFVSLVSSSVLTYVADRAMAEVAMPLWPALVRTMDLTASIVLLSCVFTAAFHFIPRSRPPARLVVGGAVLTTAMLTALKEVFALYLSHLTRYSAYGVAGGMLALTTWIYLTSLIILFGAQLTRVHAEKLGSTGQECA